MHTSKEDPAPLLQCLLLLRQEVFAEGQSLLSRWEPLIQRPFFKVSAANLAYYLALRSRDLRKLQQQLIPWGLSSLGRSEARTLSNLDAVIASLSRICGQPAAAVPFPPQRSFRLGDWLLRRNADAAFGPPPADRKSRIMVTLPSEAAADYSMVRNFLDQGMNIARINCAHDDRTAWSRMIDNIQRARRELARPCRIFMDIAGPKPRINNLLVSVPDARLFTGDRLLLSRESVFSRPPEQGAALIASCSIPEVFNQLTVGDPVMIDDGRIEAVIESLNESYAVIRITQARAKGEKIKAQKSLNFPRTPLNISSLTDKDLTDLDFIAAHADAIGYSFVRQKDDIVRLQNELSRRIGRERMQKITVIAKIETVAGVENLPAIIVQAAGVQPFGIMIARGDLAVEAGYRRLAELQEEIMWIAEAAHIPVIWATQVLENLVKKGIPSRAEITDAAMSGRTECVMLNKGPYLADAIALLDGVLASMQAHQYKKAPQLRALQIARQVTGANLLDQIAATLPPSAR